MLGAIAGDIIGSRFEGQPAPPPDFELFHPAAALPTTPCARSRWSMPSSGCETLRRA
jgi:hypothetical protein